MGKIEKLEIKSHFIQVDTVAGFRYLDKIGEIINRFHSEKTAVTNFAIDNLTRELAILNPAENITEFHVNHGKIYINGIGANLSTTANYFSTKALEIINLINVDKINRIGVRIYNKIENEERKKEIRKKLLADNKNLADFSIVFQKRVLGIYEYDMKISSAKDVGKDIILLDIDIFKKAEIEKSAIDSEIKSIAAYVLGSEFIEDINKSLDNE